jgi:hypothetical protein
MCHRSTLAEVTIHQEMDPSYAAMGRCQSAVLVRYVRYRWDASSAARCAAGVR